jgi:hypothetical protein
MQRNQSYGYEGNGGEKRRLSQTCSCGLTPPCLYGRDVAQVNVNVNVQLTGNEHGNNGNRYEEASLIPPRLRGRVAKGPAGHNDLLY